jgi:hypothetical protein
VPHADTRSLRGLTWRVAVFVLIGCGGVADRDPKPRADAQVNERVSAAKDDERLARLESGMTRLRATVDAQARELHCFEVQRVMRAAWYEHDRTVLSFVATPCDEAAGVCHDTGLPPRTFERYHLLVSQVVGEADAPFEALRARMDEPPMLPQPPVRGDAYARICSTRAAAESATKAYLAECDPADGSRAAGAGVATAVEEGPRHPRDPANAAVPKAKIPPSPPTSQ